MAQVFDMLLTKPEKFSGYAEKARSIRDMSPGMGRPNLNAEGIEIGQSTHKMATEIFDGKWYSFPTLFPDKKKPNRWIDYGGGQDEGKRADLKGAFLEAKSRGEVFDFGSDKESAIKFGLGSWKK